MSSTIFSILEKLFLLLCILDATVLGDYVEIPSTQLQKDTLARSVCTDLSYLPRDPIEIPIEVCRDIFWQDPPKKRLTSDTWAFKTEVTPMRCRSKRNIELAVTPLQRWQIVIVIPETIEENNAIDYVLIEPNSNHSDINVATPTQKYIIYSSVLNKNGQPSQWRAQNEVPAISEAAMSERRNYDVHVQFLNYNRTNEKRVTGVITWNHTEGLPRDGLVCIEINNSCGKDKIIKQKVWPANDGKFVIQDLPVDEECNIELHSIFGTTHKKYHTPAVGAHINSIAKETVEEIVKPEYATDIMVVAVQDGDAWMVRVGWAKPRVLPDSYNVTLQADDNITLVLLSNATEAIFSDVTGEGVYYVYVNSFKGPYVTQAFRTAVFPVPNSRVWRWAAAAAGALATVALALLVTLRLRKTIYRSRKLPHTQESKPLDEDLESMETEPNEDQWELKSEWLLLHEVIGEGAFGVVRRGRLTPTAKDVAVKMLKEFPSLDEVRAFRLEMELMKSVGAHPHVVSLVGCCSARRPLIVAEYCARGDLLSFLRCSWDVMVSKRNAKYYNNNIETSDYRNDLFKCKLQREHSRLAINKMYDIQSMCESDLTPLDLLSFCRQIAMGMEFLASNRLVHRDLAARNVLVTGDKTMKIADFGLSRDVYEENQYKQKGNGKMPVKWMALESLTRRIYTSQSDVWSFGVVVWEVVTVGAAPYPEVPAARLPRLLRSGYRMPKPPNCSKQLYDLMQCCWRAHPRERPSFAELHQKLDELLNSACADDYLCLELDDEPPPTPKAQKYFKMIMRGKRAWTRENYERPLKAIQGNHNHYTSTPVTLSKAPA